MYSVKSCKMDEVTGSTHPNWMMKMTKLNQFKPSTYPPRLRIQVLSLTTHNLNPISVTSLVLRTFTSAILLVCPSLSPNSTTVLLHSSVTSRLHYYNSLLFSFPVKSNQNLQPIQNSAAQIIARMPSTNHNPCPIPIQFCIIYKILLLNFKDFRTLSPSISQNFYTFANF